MQRPAPENIPVVRIHALRIQNVNVGKVRSGADDCMLISDPAEYFYDFIYQSQV